MENNYKKENNKIEISFTYITKTIAIISILLVLGGYTYNSILFNELNIKVANFFNASDYLESSVNAIVPIIISISFALITSVLTILFLSHENMKKRFIYLSITLIIVTSILIYVELNYNVESFVNYRVSDLIIVIVIYFILFYIIHKQPYVKLPHFFESYLITIIFFIVFTISNAFIDVDLIKNGKYNNSYNFIFKDKIKQDSYIYIKSISKYSFFYDIDNNNTIVIPNSEIIKITIKNKK